MNQTALSVALSIATLVVGISAELKKPLLEPGRVHKQPVELKRPTGLTLTLEEYPKTSGSTSAEPLGVWVACRLLNRPCTWPAHAQTRRLFPVLPKADEKMKKPRVTLDYSLYRKVQHIGTHGAYVQLIEGKLDLIYECRVPSADELALMKKKGVELDIRSVSLDAFVFLRNRKNAVKDLTTKQIQDIYTKAKNEKGIITNWKEVGGVDADIRAYMRNRNSGSQETMISLVMKDLPILEGRRMTGTTMIGPYNHLNSDMHGIGYTFFYYQTYMAPVRDGNVIELSQKPEFNTSPIEMFSINGVLPARATIQDGRYPFVTDVYVVTRKDLDKEHPAARLREWLLTEEGQNVVGETGYVPSPEKQVKQQAAD